MSNNESESNSSNSVFKKISSLNTAKKLLLHLVKEKKLTFEDLEQSLDAILNSNKKQANPSKNSEKKKLNLLLNCRTRTIALHLSYNGESYSGYAESVGCPNDNSVESYLFPALQKACLIENRSSCNYSRCGRTDRGVSAIGQVIALSIRSNFPYDVAETSLPSNSHEPVVINGKDRRELNYPKILNSLLPSSLKIIGWCPVTAEFSARFSASHRTYRYFFYSQHYNLNKMKEGLEYIIGSHDFRNLCKMNVEQVSNYTRLIHSATVREVNDSVAYIEICGQAFLWHQIRCIASIAFLIGKDLEEPSLFEELLNVDKTPAKPHYNMALDLPLVLHKCSFKNLTFGYNVANLFLVCHDLQQQYEQRLLAAHRILDQITTIQKECMVSNQDLKDFLCEKYNAYAKKVLKKGKKKNSIFELNLDSVNSSEKLLSCEEAFEQIYQLLPFLKYNENNSIYNPVMKRCVGTTYDEKISTLQGKRKEKYIENIVSKKQSKEHDRQFYSFMLKQGSVE